MISADKTLNQSLVFASPSKAEILKIQNKEINNKVDTLYHIKHLDFCGNELYPLNQMEKIENLKPLAKKHAEKYKNREWIREMKVSYFNCYFNDVIFLSPVHPNRIFEALKMAGYSPIQVQFLEIPFNALNKKKAVIWKCPSAEYLPIKEDLLLLNRYEKISKKALENYRTVPESTKEYYKKCFQQGLKPLIFLGLPHVLVKDKIQLLSSRVLIWSFDWKFFYEELKIFKEINNYPKIAIYLNFLEKELNVKIQLKKKYLKLEISNGKTPFNTLITHIYFLNITFNQITDIVVRPTEKTFEECQKIHKQLDNYFQYQKKLKNLDLE